MRFERLRKGSLEAPPTAIAEATTWIPPHTGGDLGAGSNCGRTESKASDSGGSDIYRTPRLFN